MLQAFKEYEHATPPSSALSETVASIERALNLGEQAFISYIKEQLVAMVRFKENDEGDVFLSLILLFRNNRVKD
ncbi:hypothetical protein [Lysinibacillus parviboronicapiens]|uniref:hypothetical protein n=1 Tax=Lysinibacillus parviboronicapiens TaxID=436516 RepID=UPI000A7ACB48|nr:hypothetical protein [Lysinibacillus parviboronicapiens]